MEVALIFILSLLIRLPFLSNWLEDWDSVQFAMAIHNFDIVNNLPHAPGYPLYVLLGKFFYFFIRNDLNSLNLISVICGSLSIALIYLLAKDMFNKRIALLSAIFTIFIPVHSLLSTSALTNVPGLFFLLLFSFLLYKYGKNKIFLISYLGGLILGIRFTEISVIVCLLLFVFIKNYRLKNLPLLVGCFSLGVLTWLFPMIIIEGFGNFYKAYIQVANYILTHDTTFGISRYKRIYHLLDLGYTKIFLILGFFSFLKVLLNKKLLKDFRFQFLAIWFLSYFFPFIFIFNTEVTRYTIPLLPPLVIITSWFLLSFQNKFLKTTSLIVTICLIIFLAQKSFSQARYFKNNIPTSISPILYIKTNYSPQNTIISGSYIYRQLEYYLPEFKTYYATPISIEDLKNQKYVILDYIGLTETLPKNINYKIVNKIGFNGDPNIYTRLSNINLYIVKLNE